MPHTSTASTRRHLPRVLLAVLLATVPVLVPTSGAAARAHVEHETVDAAAVFQTSTCPFGDWVPVVDTPCEDWLVLLYRATPGPAQQHRRAPLRVQYVHAKVVVHPDLAVDVLEEHLGDTGDLVATFDETHLLTASVEATIPMSDGTSRVVDLTWDGHDRELETAGNDGPAIASSGTPRHHVDRCVTFHANAHQTYRANTGIEGSVDGIGVGDFPYVAPYDPFLSRGRFTVVVAAHGGCD